ncbi:phytoene desaturase family protein [Staphylococcus sp. KG4-3]|uniref:4,4'-diaponeurosporene oxygenase n=1 Tax=Staphylococcus xylosus TaxID=1288 RepID=A0A418IQL7_STAXY|nr:MULTISPECIES: phytoene desaturase family protein [Staphylococcus]MDW8543347.1 phytoene desaturase family protein [Staphylococcus sp. KG4-1]MRF36626.1 phytoene desaturase [Staphylococcus sp. KY49P]MDW8562769.1 phytoene desaturase family protein [Staphylococcus sp. KG4-3]PTI06360.1 diapolycopene oxygenase [Staphylococcus xylosus]RIN11926.1 phytoene desaturase [Staphylococcus xylosus]
MGNKKVIVIGGGLGGISSAICMAQAGYKVDLYEQNKHIGGKVNRLEIDDYGFDLGPSILTMPKVFQHLFQQCGEKLEDYVSIRKLALQIRNVYPDGQIIDLYESMEDILINNETLSNKDIKQLTTFFNYAQKIHEVAKRSYFDKGLDTMSAIIRYHGPFSALKQFDYFHTMQQAINKRVENPYLREMLGYFIKYVGSSSYDAPAVLSLLPQMQHAEGLWYVDGGIHKLAEAMEQLARELGVYIHFNASVKHINYNNQSEVTGITLETNEEIYADYIISNMEVIPVYKYLLNFDEHKINKLERKFEPASSGYVMHLGVDKSYPELRHHNFFFSDNSKVNYDEVFHQYILPEDPTIYVVNTNKTDEAQAPEGHENIKILPHIPYIQNKPFSEAEYRQFRERILDKLESMGLQDLRQHIVYEDVWTPHDIENKYNSNKGAIYGVVSSKKKNKGFKFPKKSQYYKNLYFVGGSVNPGAGMPMVTLSGMQVAEAIIIGESS